MQVNSTWSALQAKFEIDNINGLGKFYRIKKNSTGFLYAVHQLLLTLTLTTRLKKVNEVFNSLPKEQDLPCLIKWEGAVEGNYQWLQKTIVSNPQTIAVHSDLTQAEMLAALAKAKQYALKGLATIKPEDTLVTRSNLDSVSDKWKQSQYAFIETMFVAEGDKIVHVDQEIFNEVKLARRGMDCGTFAFLYLKDQDFKKSIKEKGTPSLYKENAHQLLNQWNYSQVNDPNEGDLVVYFKQCIPQHYGVYQSNGKVISKKGGIDVDTIFLHDLDTIQTQYGHHFRFYRKNSKVVTP